MKLLVTEPRQASEMQEAARQFMAGPGAWDRLGPLANSLCGDPLSAWNVSIFGGLNGEKLGFVLEDLMGFKMSKRIRKRITNGDSTFLTRTVWPFWQALAGFLSILKWPVFASLIPKDCHIKV